MISDIARLRPGVVTRSISPENPTGAPTSGWSLRKRPTYASVSALGSVKLR